jgi:hypothetical protein
MSPFAVILKNSSQSVLGLAASINRLRGGGRADAGVAGTASVGMAL